MGQALPPFRRAAHCDSYCEWLVTAQYRLAAAAISWEWLSQTGSVGSRRHILSIWGADVLAGRKRECEFLYGLLSRVRSGSSASLLVRGEAGIGKTALIDDAIASASDLRVERAVGVEAAMELAFAGLQQLCGQMLDRLDHLPEQQRDALRTIFGMTAGPPPDRLLVGLAVLGLLSEVARERPLLCVVEDAQWLDRASAQALTFAARRLGEESVLMLFAAREAGNALSSLPELVVGGLRPAAARELLASVIHGPLDVRVRDRIVAETGGNPLALLELPRGLSPAQLAGGFGLADAPPLHRRIEENFRQRFEGLPEDTRLFVITLAADPVGEPTLIWGAIKVLGVLSEAALPAAEAGLVDVDSQMVFRHPLVRSAVYRAASKAERQRVHAALAEVIDPQVDPDRRAWHRAKAMADPDEDIAAELERSAHRAQRRGGLAAAAAFLEQAVGMTPDSARRTQRALTAADVKLQAGDPDASLDLLTAAEAGPIDESQQARANLLRARIAFLERRGEAPRLLVRAARQFEPLDVRTARDTYLDAIIAAHFAGRLVPGGVLRETAGAARRAPQPAQRAMASDLLLDGLAGALIDGYAAGAPVLMEAVRAFRSPDVSVQEELHWLWPAAHVAMSLWDDASYEVLAARHIDLGRQTGLLAVLPTALTTRIVAHVFVGELTYADRLIGEQRALTDAMGIPIPPYGPLFVAGWQGGAESIAAIEAAIPEITARGEGGGLAFADYARAVLFNGLGRYDEALDAAAAADAFDSEGFVIATQCLVELIEAAARAGAVDRAAEAMGRLSETTTVTGTDWGAGMRARSQALLSPDWHAEALYRESIERLGQTRIRPQLARAHLLYGEWLRGQDRLVEARDNLRSAYEMCQAMGLESFAERARRELLAAGESISRRASETLSELTDQEAHIARLAVAGYTNPEIGAELFISARTVEWHLRKVFTKLGVRSRRELRRVLPNLESHT